MATLNKKELEDLHYFATSGEKIVQLINEKKEALGKLYNNQSSSFQTLDPAPKPKGDIRLTPEKKLNKGLKDAQSKIIEDTRNSYDDKIEKVARENINNFGYEHHKEKMNTLSKEDVVLLVEKGPDAVFEKQKQQELEKKESTKEEKELHQEPNVEPEINPTQSKELNPNKEKPQEVDVGQSMKLSNAQRDAIIENGSYIDFDENGKDMDVDKSQMENEPSDFQKNAKDISDDFE